MRPTPPDPALTADVTAAVQACRHAEPSTFAPLAGKAILAHGRPGFLALCLALADEIATVYICSMPDLNGRPPQFLPHDPSLPEHPISRAAQVVACVANRQRATAAALLEAIPFTADDTQAASVMLRDLTLWLAKVSRRAVTPVATPHGWAMRTQHPEPTA